MPKVSIIVPVYNQEKYLDRSIQSLVNQTLYDIEIILINDGSIDDSLNICKKYEQMDKRIIIIDKPNRGVSSARNEGIEIAKGEYIGFVDSDDWIENNMYDNMYKYIEKENADMCACNYWIETCQGSMEQYNGLKKTMKNEEIRSFIIPSMISFGQLNEKEEVNITRGMCNYLYKRNILMEHRIRLIEDLPIGEDFMFNIEYMNNIGKIAVDPGRYYHYALNDESAMNRYRINWWEVHKRLVKNIEDYLNEQKNSSKLNKSLSIMRFNYIVGSVVNEAHNDNKKSYNEKIRTLENIFKEDLVRNTLKEYNPKGTTLSRKVYFRLFRNRRIRILYGYYRMKNMIINIKSIRKTSRKNISIF